MIPAPCRKAGYLLVDCNCDGPVPKERTSEERKSLSPKACKSAGLHPPEQARARYLCGDNQQPTEESQGAQAVG